MEARQIAERDVSGQHRFRVERHESAPVYSRFAIQRVVEKAAAARKTTIEDPLHALAWRGEAVAGVIDDRQPVELFVVRTEAPDIGEALFDRYYVGQRAGKDIDRAQARGVEQ